MADETRPAIGMSVGATALAAVTAERAITRRPVLTLYPDRPPQIGVPTENPDIGEPGLVITGFVDQVGVSAPVLASDGSAHRGEQLLADGLHALAYSATEGRPLPPAVAVTYPAHWPQTAVDALRAALSRVPEWSQHPVLLISDASAALTALQANPGLPAGGVIAVCDFGGSGSSITLVDAANHCEPIDVTVRHTGFSGDLIDQALLDHVIADLTAEGSLEGASAIGSLARLRDQCRNAKEQLSTNTVTELPVDLPGFHSGVWLTRAELEEVIREPFDRFLEVVRNALDRNGIQPAALAAVVSVGGGANIPALTNGLSERFGVVVSSPRPHLTAAIGAALRVAGDPAGTVAPTPITPAVPAAEPVAPPPPMPPEAAPAWPVPAPVPGPPEITPAATDTAPIPHAAALPGPAVDYQPFPDDSGRAAASWYRQPMPVILAIALAVLIAGIIAVIALRHAADSEPATSTVTSEPSEPSEPAGPTVAGVPPVEPPTGTAPEAPAPSEERASPGEPAHQPTPENPETPTTP